MSANRLISALEDAVREERSAAEASTVLIQSTVNRHHHAIARVKTARRALRAALGRVTPKENRVNRQQRKP